VPYCVSSESISTGYAEPRVDLWDSAKLSINYILKSIHRSVSSLRDGAVWRSDPSIFISVACFHIVHNLDTCLCLQDSRARAMSTVTLRRSSQRTDIWLKLVSPLSWPGHWARGVESNKVKWRRRGYGGCCSRFRMFGREMYAIFARKGLNDLSQRFGTYDKGVLGMRRMPIWKEQACGEGLEKVVYRSGWFKPHGVPKYVVLWRWLRPPGVRSPAFYRQGDLLSISGFPLKTNKAVDHRVVW